ncbi:MAG: fasciclin domain-containing protein [Bacteroidia bacterium]
MKKIFLYVGLSLSYFAMSSCGGTESTKNETAGTEQTTAVGQSGVADNESQQDVVKVAVNSPDHTTLVKAVQTAELVDALSNAGPFTVFAPVNAAFDLLPAGTVETLLKPENKSKLQDILQHHVYVGVLKVDQLKDGQVIGMVDGTNATVHVKDGKTYIDESLILGSATASNGVVHVMDKVILPK